MKVKITEKGVSGYAVGDIVSVKSDVLPGWLINKGEIVSKASQKAADTAEGAANSPAGADEVKTAVTNPAAGALPPPAAAPAPPAPPTPPAPKA